MKDAARRAFGGANSDACDFSRGLARPGSALYTLNEKVA